MEEYLSNAAIVQTEEVSLELPISAEEQDKFEDTSVMEEQQIDMTMREEPMIDIASLLPQMSTDVQDRNEYITSAEENPIEPPIVLPQIQPVELPISDSIQNNIEEIANKLQSAGKITPVIDIAQKETPPASEQDLPVSMGFVTPTLAEIYAKQGWFDDAIKAYKALARNKPGEKERFERRIEELEKLKNQGKK